MSLSDKIIKELKKIGFEPDPPDNTFVVYKGLDSDGEWTNVSLYFSDDDGKGKLDFGFWVEETVDETLRENLKVELNNVALGNKCGKPKEEEAEGGFWVYCTLTAKNDSVVEWLISAMEELERRAMFMINK